MEATVFLPVPMAETSKVREGDVPPPPTRWLGNELGRRWNGAHPRPERFCDNV